jgi:hypothetical protein
MGETLTVTWWLTFLSRILLVAILAVSFLYMARSMPGIRLLERLAADGVVPTGFELYQSGVMRECSGPYVDGPYVLAVLLPPTVWAWLAPALGVTCLWFAKLRAVLNLCALPWLALVSAFFFCHAEAIQKIADGLE